MAKLIIRGTRDVGRWLYWNNSLGWVNRSNAQLFDYIDSLPIGWSRILVAREQTYSEEEKRIEENHYG